jgi:hypothetical protein
MTTEKPDPAALVPCPWCGCKPEKLSVTEGSTFRWRLVECPECGAGPGEIRVQTMGEGTREDWEAKAHVDAIAAWNTRALQPQGPTTPAGYKLVPVEPTEHMIEIGREAVTRLAAGSATVRCYKAMLAAAPTEVK